MRNSGGVFSVFLDFNLLSRKMTEPIMAAAINPNRHIERN
jgi:hypothetical protein